MCGIVGIVGKEQAQDVLIDGLEKLEYRGYDSAGIYVEDYDTTGHFVKEVGQIAELKNKITPEVTGTIGIGHTRWATHGVPSEGNAHPHMSANGRFVLVHNGVIENYNELKQTYLANANFHGETDSEVIVQLIAYFVEQGLATADSFKHVLSLIEGSYAFGLIEVNKPDTLYVAKNKSPLLIGVGSDFNGICSDAMALIAETNEFIEIMDREFVTLTKENIVIENQAGEIVTRASYKAEINLADIEKGTYPYYMLKEIDEQPAVMRKIIKAYTNNNQQFEIAKEIIAEVTNCDRIYIVACGTSAHAGWVGKNLLEQCTNIPVEVHISSEMGYHMPVLSKKPLFVFISQSGETADSRQVLVKVNELGYPSLTITNVAGSTLSREATHTLLLHAGPEIAVASTKAYTAQAAVLAVLAKVVGENLNVDVAKQFDLIHELGLVATAMEASITNKQQIAKITEAALTNTRNAFYIGRANDYYVSMEAALKLKEISYIQAEGFAAGELKHGTIALIEQDTPVIAIISDEVTASHTRGNIQEVASRGAKVIVLAMSGLEKNGDAIVVPKVHELLTPLAMVVATQLIAYYATLQRGYDVDKPRNLAKSVTVE